MQYRWWRLDGPVADLHAAVDALRRDTVPERVARASWQRQAQARRAAFRLLVCGARDWTDRALLAQVVKRVVAEQAAGRPVVLIEGDARGADRLAGELAQAHGWQVERYPAPWQRHGRTAGPIRNAHMLRLGRPERVLAFTDDLAHSRGTADLVRRARAAGLPIQVTSHGGCCGWSCPGPASAWWSTTTARSPAPPRSPGGPRAGAGGRSPLPTAAGAAR